MNCLFCNSNGPYNTIEHIIPEALGNDDLILSGHVCDDCQSYFGKEIEKFVLDKTLIGFWRIFLGIRGKKNKLSRINLNVPTKRKGVLPQWNEVHDNRIGLTAHDDGTTSVDIDNLEIVKQILSGERTKFQFVLSPKHLVQLGRFLGKIALELLCKENPETARCTHFDELRKYIRYGHTKKIWPIFHANKGDLKDLRAFHNQDNEILEDVFCYEYGMHIIQDFWLFSFHTGLDFWVICMNNPYPTPVIREVYPDVELDLLWYPRESWNV